MDHDVSPALHPVDDLRAERGVTNKDLRITGNRGTRGGCGGYVGVGFIALVRAGVDFVVVGSGVALVALFAVVAFVPDVVAILALLAAVVAVLALVAVVVFVVVPVVSFV